MFYKAPAPTVGAMSPLGVLIVRKADSIKGPLLSTQQILAAHPALTFSLGIKVGVGADDYCRALESLTRDVHRRELLRTRSAMARSHNGGNFCKVDEKGYNP